LLVFLSLLLYVTYDSIIYLMHHFAAAYSFCSLSFSLSLSLSLCVCVCVCIQSMTFQGIIPYFYDHLHPGTGVELDPCVYNNMAHNPRDKPTKNDIVSGNCRNGYNRPEMNDECEDCRSRPIEEIFTTHFTLCQKPWECHPQDGDRIQERLCRKFHGEWFRVREDLETSMWKRDAVDLDNADEVTKVRGGKFQPQQFKGYCKGANSYIPITLPENGELAKAN
jgi:hypothetical protein